MIAQTAAHISSARLADTGSGSHARRGAMSERTRPMMWPFLPSRDWVNAAGLPLMLSATACATLPTPQVAAPPPGQARIWFYRLWDPSESLNVANIDVNGVYAGSVEPGGAFYRDVGPGVYHIVPENRYFDYNQNTNVAVVPGEQVFIAVLDLSSWATAVSGAQWYVRRDAWYVRLVPPQFALAQIASPALVPRPSARPAAASGD